MKKTAPSLHRPGETLLTRWLPPFVFSPVEQMTLRLCMLTPPQPQEMLILDADIPWQRIVQVAQQGQLLPILGWKSLHQDTLPPSVRHYFQRWPSSVHQELQRHYRQSWIQQEHRKRHWQTVRDALQQADIPYVLYKGMGYAHSWYPDPAMRSMKDVDIVIPLSAHPTVSTVLSALGLQEHPMTLPHPCATSFSHPTQSFHLDVHHRISWPYHTKIPEAIMLLSEDTASSEGPIFGPTQQFLFHIYHMCKEQWLPQHTPLRAFVELRELYLRLRDSLPSVQERAKRWGMAHILDCGLWWLHLLSPGLLPHHAAHPSLLGRLSFVIRYPEKTTPPLPPPLHTALRGLLLLFMIDDSWDRLSYLQQRLSIRWQQR